MGALIAGSRGVEAQGVGDGVEHEAGVVVVEAGEQVVERDAGVDAGQLGDQAQDAGLAARQRRPLDEVGDGVPDDPGDGLGAVVVVVDAGGDEVGPVEQAAVPAEELGGGLVGVVAGGRGSQQGGELVGG